MACGRRWGKTEDLVCDMAEHLLAGRSYGYFAPSYKLLSEVYDRLRGLLAPVASAANKSEKTIRLVTGGSAEFWTLDDPDAGRSRRYHKVAVDEAGLVTDLGARWNEAILPTLGDFRGSAEFRGTPKGRNYFHSLFQRGGDPCWPEWAAFRAPTGDNPHLPPGVQEEFRRAMPDRTYRQEILAEFLDEAGGVFPGYGAAVDAGRVSLADPQGPVTFGLDLAKTEDFSVLVGLDAIGRQCLFDRWHRVPWAETYARVTRHMERHPRALLTIDSTGVGDPPYEALRNLLPDHRIDGYRFNHASKEALVENLQMLIERGGVRLFDDPVQRAEMESFEYRLTRTGLVSTSAPEGMHDDTVVALMLAAWPFRPKAPTRFTFYGA